MTGVPFEKLVTRDSEREWDCRDARGRVVAISRTEEPEVMVTVVPTRLFSLGLSEEFDGEGEEGGS